MPITLGYWKVRGYGQPIRYMLAHAGVEFEETLYTMDEADKWHGQDKKSLPLDFPNLPYLFDGDVKLTQTNAILRYLGRKLNMAGSNEMERIRIDLTEQQVQDYWGNVIKLAYTPTTTPDDIETFRKTGAADSIASLSKFLGSNQFFSGGSISYADFKAYEFLFIIKLLAPEAIEAHENIKQFMSRIEESPRVKAFIQSDRHIPWPITAPFAKWGNSVSNPELAPK